MKFPSVNSKKLTRLSLSVIGAALLAIGATTAARADAIYNFTLDGCSGNCGPQASFGTIDLHQVDPDTVQITVSLLNGNKFVTTGSHEGFAFNIQGSAVTIGVLPSGWGNPQTNQSEPGFGTFSNTIDCEMGNSNAKTGCAGDNPWVGDLIFEVNRGSGLVLSDFVGNSHNPPIFFATDIISGTTGKTGLVASDGSSPVPEPGTLALLGTGILGFATVLRRKVVGHTGINS